MRKQMPSTPGMKAVVKGGPQLPPPVDDGGAGETERPPKPDAPAGVVVSVRKIVPIR